MARRPLVYRSVPIHREQGTSFVLCAQYRRINFKLNSRLEKLLDLSLEEGGHWASTADNFWQLFHLATTFNPEAIAILLKHVQAHDRLFRCVAAHQSRIRILPYLKVIHFTFRRRRVLIIPY